MTHDPDPEVLLRITICQRNEDHWLGSRVRITYNKNPALTVMLMVVMVVMLVSLVHQV
ncbi:hypothetical protein Hanom_Chr00s000005g01611941 [Helianthus anomalus]